MLSGETSNNWLLVPEVDSRYVEVLIVFLGLEEAGRSDGLCVFEESLGLCYGTVVKCVMCRVSGAISVDWLRQFNAGQRYWAEFRHTISRRRQLQESTQEM